MSRIDEIFQTLRGEGRTALMPFITAGYPSPEVTAETIPALEAAGAHVVELGVPFSDPIADGAVIASSMHEALLQGVSPRVVFDIVRDVRERTGLGLIAMVSCSIVDRYGRRRFVDDAAEAGIDGLIVPDIDLADADELRSMAADRDLAFALLIAPTTSRERAARIAERCLGFVYMLARLGLTGERDDAPDIDARVAELRTMTDLPIAVGFGISQADHVRAVTRAADAAIVGSALVRRMGSAADPVAAAKAFVAELAGGLSVPTS